MTNDEQQTRIMEQGMMLPSQLDGGLHNITTTKTGEFRIKQKYSKLNALKPASLTPHEIKMIATNLGI